jgi:hypothetical protein
MLVAEQERWKADQLMERLGGIFQRAMADQEYLLDLSLGSRLDTQETTSAAPGTENRADGGSVDTPRTGLPAIRLSDETGKTFPLISPEPHKQRIIPTNQDVSAPHSRSISRSLLTIVTTSMSSVIPKTLLTN